MATTNLTLFGSNARQIKPYVVNLFSNNNRVDSLEFQMENYNQGNVDLSTLDPYAICYGQEFLGGLDEVKLTSEVTEDGILRIYWDLTLMTLAEPQTIQYQIVFKNNEGQVWTSHNAILMCNGSLTADEEIVAQYPTILKQMENRIEVKTDEATQGAVEEITNTVSDQVNNALNQVNQMAQSFDASVVYIPYNEKIPVEYRVSNRLYYQYTNADNTKGRFEDYMGNVLISEGSGGGAGGGLPMFAHIWSDHKYNDASYLLADNFSWHYASVYVTAYDKLEEQYNHESSVEQTDGDVTYKLTPDGFKIADVSQHENIRTLYEETGSAWFYIIDVDNKRFKLPREKAELQIHCPSVAGVTVNDLDIYGDGKTLGLTDGTNNAGIYISNAGLTETTKGCGVSVGDSISFGGLKNSVAIGVTTDPEYSGITGEGTGTADLSGITTERVDTDGKKYLYFYVGDYEREATEVNVGEVSESLNNKVDLDGSNFKGSELEDYIHGHLNNPFSLLDYKYSEYELNNISWLRSQGQFNSNTIYPAVYELLLKIYNGTETKAGVNVKLATEDYSDTDFVLNPQDNTFRLPIKVKLASGKAVVGNGMTLGLSDGAKGVALTGYNSSSYGARLAVNTTLIGSPIGTANSTYTADNVLYGVTKQPDKSGIETSDNDLYLYFYVGETVQNANLINAGRIEETLAYKVDINSSWGFPSDKYVELTLGASGTTYTAPANGYFCHIGTFGTTAGYVLLDNTNTKLITQSYGGNNVNSHVYLPAKKGDVVKATYMSTKSGAIYFVYAEGEV